MIKSKPILEILDYDTYLDDKATRLEMTKSFVGFCLVYFNHYFSLPAADFHKEMLEDLNDWSIDFLDMTGFRGSAKSTFVGMALPIYAALTGKSRFIIPINETEDVVKLTIANIREELLTNELLRFDYGITKLSGGKNLKFTETNVMVPGYDFRILGRGRGQKIRGLRHRQYRPDLVILDDVEERKKVKNKSYRDESENWLRNDVIPSCEENGARLLLLGNELHKDALMARIRKDDMFIHRKYSLFNGKEPVWKNCVWKGKYPDQEALDRQKRKVGSLAWQQEYLLNPISPEDQVVKEDWIRYWDSKKVPKIIGRTAVGVDPAISKNAKADYTAMVAGFTAEVDGDNKIHIIPGPVEERLNFNETLGRMQAINSLLSKKYSSPMFYLEKVAYQSAAIEEAGRRGLPVEGIKPGNDKRARLMTVAPLIENGTVLFADKGCERLIEALLNFGIEEHDDLVDAFVYLVLSIISSGLENLDVISLD